ncbi:peptide/nickel transport system substrate-binding protein [Actinomadura meyerae]|uniref:Peptide/nickel transport system substrate-binding protein n=1 Tax=Actinomadura meyerae TaxID=240840 RepID=A0A239KU99_9ACTN|nr:ABC transporter substrate-binding protein [Actinomadura meyerae]SNT21645.1 peptide/nickel transport system substrate-binding protein [Actinomadura meyerae]
MTARQMYKVTVGLTGLMVGLAGCAGGGDDASAAGRPREGGTLRIVGSSDVEHLDPASVSSVGAYGLTRTFARTLFGTRASNDFQETVPVRPDVAERVPTRENGDIGKDRRSYTVRLRTGVLWNTDPPRPVTAHDFVRGFERLCNPAAPSSGKGYFVSTIKGMDEFCRGYARVDAKDPAAMAAYQRDHAIEGLRAADDRTLVFRLRRPASDFLNLLALPYTAAAPKEYDAYVPDGPQLRRNTISNGPYQITEYRPGLSYELSRNPAWRAAADPLRERHVAKIRITLGQDSPEAVQQQLEQGTADLAWDQPVPTSAIPRLRDDPRFAIRETPNSSPYLVFNLRSPNNRGALGERAVRQALEYAVDRSALIKIVGGPSVARPLHTVIPPGNSGYSAIEHYPTPGETGDPAKCRELLGRTGRTGLKLKFPYRTNSVHKLIAQSIADNLDACGVETELIADSGGSFYAGTLGTPARGRAGEWDIAAPGWVPDWYGNNGRSIIQPLFDGRGYGQNSTNYGGYNNPQVNALIDAALTAPDAGRAAGYWQQADQKIMEDAVIVPLLDRAQTLFHSSRVHGALYLPTTSGYDYTRLWLS